jgi:general nucleoside transport system permease protein
MNFPYQLEARVAPSRTMQLAVPLAAFVLTLVIGWLIFGLVGRDPGTAMKAFFIDPISTRNGLAELLLKASPLCLIGLGLAIGYRANVWNIGAEGQMMVGGIFAAGVAIYVDNDIGWWLLPLMMLAAVIGGMLWAAIPAYLKTRFNTNETLVSLMLTYVATQLLIYLVSGPWRDPNGMNFPLSQSFTDDALFPRLYAGFHWTFWKGTRINASIFVTLIAIPVAWAYMKKSFSGFKMNVGGLAPLAARYAGFSDARTIWSAMLISGATAGLAGVSEIAGPIGQLQSTWSPGYGFTAIICVFVGRLHPIGITLASLLMALLYLGGESVQISLQLPQAISGVFQGLLLFSLLGCDLFVNYRLRRRGTTGLAH